MYLNNLWMWRRIIRAINQLGAKLKHVAWKQVKSYSTAVTAKQTSYWKWWCDTSLSYISAGRVIGHLNCKSEEATSVWSSQWVKHRSENELKQRALAVTLQHGDAVSHTQEELYLMALYKKSCTKSCAKGSLLGALKGLRLEGLEEPGDWRAKHQMKARERWGESPKERE